MDILKVLLVIFFYIFTLTLTVTFVGLSLQRLDLRRKGYSEFTVNAIFAVITIVIYALVVFLFINDWAANMLKPKVTF